VRAALGAVAAACLLSACGSSSPAGPGALDMPGLAVPTGPHVLRVILQGPCPAADGRSLLPLTFTRVTVTRGTGEWIAAASSPGAGDVELRFRQSDSIVRNGVMRISGTIKGTAIYNADVPPAPTSLTRASFGADGATVSGFAFEASSLAPTAGSTGVGTGPIAFSDADGHSCSGSGFVWSLTPQP
jgi:hypothetical protein